ncbi:phage tail protein [Acidovorax sp. Root219]|uniref:phage tail protein n=1 Tax=Acidovorax sp. Root219 TaxID=1736493 RepID=UPI0009E87604|nr:tail fiber protein [Acidovorax sp. Root219]
MSEPFIGEIRHFAFSFAPRGWMACQGQILSIAQNTALFSILGTTYGGNGQTTFALPNFAGRTPIQQGQGPGLSPYVLGEQLGATTVTLTAAHIPPHTHLVSAVAAVGTSDAPAGNALAQSSIRSDLYAATAPDTAMSSFAVNTAGGGQPHNNMPPYMAVGLCIATEGIFPSRN